MTMVSVMFGSLRIVAVRLATIPSSDELCTCDLTDVIPTRRAAYYSRAHVASAVQGALLVNVSIALGFQWAPPSSEYACSVRNDVGVMSRYSTRTRTVTPRMSCWP
jgi:hypothetical protein